MPSLLEFYWKSLNVDFEKQFPMCSSETKNTKEEKKSTAQKKNLCPHQAVWCWSVMLSCFLLVWKVTWLEEQQPQIPGVLPGRREDGPRVVIVMFSPKLSEGKKKHRHVDHIF